MTDNAPTSPEWLDRLPPESQAFLARFKSSAGSRETSSRSVESGSCLGPYRLVAELGRGAMGLVFLAEEEEPHRMVALKVMSPQLAGDDIARERFHREARLVASLKHENIVRVHASGEFEGAPYCAMEFVEGQPISRLIGQGLPANRAAKLALQIARGLAYAHKRGLLHRDIKPSNVLVSSDDRTENARIIDFGLAREIEDPGLTISGTILGTPAYAAPEQLQGDPALVDTRADLYSLGATLYQMLTGAPPISAKTILAAVKEIADGTPVLPKKLRPGIPRDIENICLRLLAKEPGRRYQTADELAEDLERFLDGEAVRATPPTFAYLVRRWVGRHRALSSVLAGSLLAISSIAVAAFVRIEARRQEAQDERDRARRLLQGMTILEKAQPRLADAWRRQYLATKPGAVQEAARSALEIIARAREVAPELATVHYSEGRARYFLEDYDAAEASLERALELAPGLTSARYWIARIRIESSMLLAFGLPGSELRDDAAANAELESAKSQIDAALADPTGFDDRLNLDHARAMLAFIGRSDGAQRTQLERIAREVVDREGESEGVEVFLFLLAMADTENARRRIDYLDRALAIRPRYGIARLLRGLLLIRRPGELGEVGGPAGARQTLSRAIDDLTVAIEERAEPYIAHIRRAEAHAKLARTRSGFSADSRRLDRLEAEPVLADLARAIEIRPALAQAYLYRASIYHEIGLETEAQKDRETAAQRRQD